MIRVTFLWLLVLRLTIQFMMPWCFRGWNNYVCIEIHVTYICETPSSVDFWLFLCMYLSYFATLSCESVCAQLHFAPTQLSYHSQVNVATAQDVFYLQAQMITLKLLWERSSEEPISDEPLSFCWNPIESKPYFWCICCFNLQAWRRRGEALIIRICGKSSH